MRSTCLIASRLISKFLSLYKSPKKKYISTTAEDDAEQKLKDSSVFNSTSSQYVEEIYKAWRRNPSSVHSSWDIFFRNLASTDPKFARTTKTINEIEKMEFKNPMNFNLITKERIDRRKKMKRQQKKFHLYFVKSENLKSGNKTKFTKEINDPQLPDSICIVLNKKQADDGKVLHCGSYKVLPLKERLGQELNEKKSLSTLSKTTENSTKSTGGKPPTTVNFKTTKKEEKEEGTSSKIIKDDRMGIIHSQYPISFKNLTSAKNTISSDNTTTTTTSLSTNPNAFFTNPIDSNIGKPPNLIQEKLVKNMLTPPGGGGGGAGGKAPTEITNQDIEQQMAVHAVIRSYQVRGHLIAEVDPLGILYSNKISLAERKGEPPKEVTRQHEGKIKDLNKSITLPPTTFIGAGKKSLPLKDIIARMENAYCRHIGVEYMHIQDMPELQWIREKLETPGVINYNKESKIRLLKRIARASLFESFLAKKWPSEKRFGLEGGETFIPLVKEMIDTSTSLGTEKINFSMAHRGRMNFIANVCRMPLKYIFPHFVGIQPEEIGSGDVKYHLGLNVNRVNTVNQKNVTMTLCANPSHLEVASSLCLGKTKCEQVMSKDKAGDKHYAVIIHGDAAFAGQGICYECLNLSYLPKYTTHGSIHIVINNQIGFTTDPRLARSSRYCSDVGRVVQAPILHVNGDDPECVIYVAKIAAEWRQKFHKDIVIDLVCYRRNGHNEIDEPMFTQPLMYQRIRKLPNVLRLYSNKLIEEGIMTQGEIDEYSKKYEDICEADFAKAKEVKTIKYSTWLESPWKGFFKNFKFLEMPKTGISEEDINIITKKFSSPPPKDFVVHKGITRILKNRQKLIADKTTDWAIGEALAYASLMKEGVHVRLSGEDVERGTFAHRHHILHHQTTDKKVYNILKNVFPNQAKYTVCNSPLTEYAVVGFEAGYAQVHPHILVMWEAQFGDFFNGAQIVIDQFLSSGQKKWMRQSGVVLLLPHGMEGMGPEHSSSRPERFLQMSEDDIEKGPFDEHFVLKQHLNINWFVANCTTPASVFHLLRRQMKLPFRKPLILMYPKSLLRNEKARSKFDEYKIGTQFQRMIPDHGPGSSKPDKVRKLIFCSGKTYYDLVEWFNQKKLEEEVAIARLEQLSPFPYDLVQAELKKFKKARVYWAQEEHKNQGGWFYVKDRITAACEDARYVEYIGRDIAAAPAVGNKTLHLQEIAKYQEDAVKMPS